MKKFLLGLLVYLLIGCFVTYDYISNVRNIGMAGIVILPAGPFIWPMLLAGRIKDANFRKEIEQNIDQNAQSELAENMKRCPEGFEPICRTYFTAYRIRNQVGPLISDEEAYAALLLALKSAKVPADEAGRDLVRDMALRFGARRPLAQAQYDVIPLLATPAENPTRAAAAALLQGAFQREAENRRKPGDPYLYGEYYYTPYKDPVLASFFASVLKDCIVGYGGDSAPYTSPGTPPDTATNSSAVSAPPSYGMATLYQAYSTALADPAMKQHWREKALAEYAALAKTRETATDAAKALYSFCLLSQDDAAKMALLKDMDAAVTARGKILSQGKAERDRITPLWDTPLRSYGAPSLGGESRPDASRNDSSIIGRIPPLFTETEVRIDATYYLLKLFTVEYGPPAKDKDGIIAGKWRTIAYVAATNSTPPDTRWLHMVMRLLRDTHPSYPRNHLYFEAEQALLLGKPDEAKKLMRDYCSELAPWGPETYPAPGSLFEHGANIYVFNELFTMRQNLDCIGKR